MTDSRKRYDDTYNPVFEIGVETQPELNEEADGEKAGSAKDAKSGRGIAHRVKRTKNSRSGGRKNGGDSGKSGKTENADGGESSESVFSKIRAFFGSQTARWIFGIVLGGVAAIFLVAFISYFANCIKDQASIINSPVGSLPPVGNSAGEGGARIAEFFINESFGLGSFVIIFWMIALSLRAFSGWPRFKTVNFTIKCIVALITVSMIIGLLTLSFNSPVNWGGYHGRYVNEYIIGFFGWTGAVIICLMLVAIFFVICLRDFVNWIIRKKNQIAERRRIAAAEKAERLERERKLEELELRKAEEELLARREAEAAEMMPEDSLVTFGNEDVDIDPSLGTYDLDDEPEEEHSRGNLTGYELDDEMPAGSNAEEFGKPESAAADDTAGRDPDAYEADAYDVAGESAGESAGDDSAKGEAAVDEAEKDDNPAMVVNVNQIAQVSAAESRKAAGSGEDSLIKTMYKFPSPLLLREGETKVSVDELEQQANQERIRETLLYHGIPITDISATVGPTVTLYEIRPDQGVKIARIKNLADDIALSLSAIGVRIIAPIPGKGTVGIEVANNDPQTVSMRTIIMSRKYNETRFRLPVALGSTIGNDVYIADLTKMPHLLVAGATGQGKSVGLNAIIASLLYKKRPDELKFVMIDPKEVEFSLYAKIERHYLAKLQDSDPIVTDMSKVVDTLKSLCVEMDNRYKLLRLAEVRNIEEYNSKIAQHKLNPNEGHRFLPYIVLVVDEFADLIMTSGKEVETPIARLAQKARAIGIHVIIATQRPSTNVITGLIKANFPVRIAFKVSSGVDSKTILDTTGAQSLIGRGDMLISNNSEMVRVQCAFIDTPEVEGICNYISRQPFNRGPYILPEPPMGVDGDGGGNGGGGAIGERDPLFEEVAELVVTSGQGSTSGIQRRYSIGYNRAGKIMDQLEHYGVVGPSLGGKPRQVLMDMYALEELLRTLRS